MDARMVSFNFKNRVGFRDTYSVFGRLKKLALDWFSLSECPGSDWDSGINLVMSGMGLQMPFGDRWKEDGLKDSICRSVGLIRDSLARTCIPVVVEDSTGEA
ncbi:unnamed protein product [Vicia faba]|uniref:Uncharacterized protein n=1 Tax=Vicia faba TaxID=3906 RepID=A0AAV1AUQ8_VICFA|nr:unnamed protein product [Vicia faba]